MIISLGVHQIWTIMSTAFLNYFCTEKFQIKMKYLCKNEYGRNLIQAKYVKQKATWFWKIDVWLNNETISKAKA